MERDFFKKGKLHEIKQRVIPNELPLEKIWGRVWGGVCNVEQEGCNEGEECSMCKRVNLSLHIQKERDRHFLLLLLIKLILGDEHLAIYSSLT